MSGSVRVAGGAPTPSLTILGLVSSGLGPGTLDVVADVDAAAAARLSDTAAEAAAAELAGALATSF